jgi:Rrf2 family protein
MSANSRFTIAVHILTLLALAQESMSSSEIAASINVNPVTVRRTIGQLKAAGLVDTCQGAAGGATLSRAACSMTLADVYEAVRETGPFALHHEAPSLECPVGRSIAGVLTCMYDEAEAAMVSELRRRTIASVLEEVQARA